MPELCNAIIQIPQKIQANQEAAQMSAPIMPSKCTALHLKVKNEPHFTKLFAYNAISNFLITIFH